MTPKLDLDEILLKVAKAKANSDLVPALVARVRELEAELNGCKLLADAQALSGGSEILKALNAVTSTAVLREREACAKVVDAMLDDRARAAMEYGGGDCGCDLLESVATAIRARET